MHHIDYRATHLETFTKQKHCDVFFSCQNDSDDQWLSIGAHKLLLFSVSDVFETMFYGQAVEGGAVKEENEIKITDIKMETFKLFLGFIYGNETKFEDAYSVYWFYYAVHKYNCKDALKFVNEYMLTNIDPESSIVFLRIAELYKIGDVKKACLKMFAEKTKEVLNGQEFLRSSPDEVQLIFGKADIEIDSEMDLVDALERYINFNKAKDPEIVEKTRPALNCIRFLTLTPTNIANTSLLTSDEKVGVIGSLPPAGRTSRMPASLSLSSTKRKGTKALEDSDMKMIRALNEVFLSSFCIFCTKQRYQSPYHALWSCPNNSITRKPELQKIYQKYNHTFLIEYEAADLKTVYDTYKTLGCV